MTKGLKDRFQKQIVPILMKELGCSNSLAVPRLIKATLNMGIGRISGEKEALEKAISDLTLITGQKAIACLARKAIAGFKIRQGQPIGAKVTLRGERMFEFLDKLFNIILPRTRDFKGLSFESFDGSGNFSLGLPEQTVFPEIDPGKIDKPRGLEITITTTAENDEEGRKLLKALGCPFYSST